MSRVLGIFLFLLLVSCSVKHTGFNSVSSTNSWAKASGEIEASDISNSSLPSITPNEIPAKETKKFEVKENSIKSRESNSVMELSPNKSSRKENRRSEKSILKEDDDKPEKQLNITGLISFLLTVFSFVPFIPIINLLMLLTGFVMAIVSLVEFKRSPGKYFGKVFPIIAIVLFALVIVLIVLILLWILALLNQL